VFLPSAEHFRTQPDSIAGRVSREQFEKAVQRLKAVDDLLVRTITHIRSNGYEGRFYRKKITYYEETGLVYWTMGAQVEETTIINRCRREDSFEARSMNGTLP
jgi:hypothetical protein